MPAMFTCARTAGWSAHILEQKRLGRLVRPSAVYDGHGPRKVEDVAASGPGRRGLTDPATRPRSAPYRPALQPTRDPPRGSTTPARLKSLTRITLHIWCEFIRAGSARINGATRVTHVTFDGS